MLKVSHLGAAFAVLAISTVPAMAQKVLPDTIKFIQSGGTGGGSDIGARIVAQAIKEAGGPDIYMENRSGGGQQIGLAALKNSPPDGSVIGLCESTAMTMNPWIFKKLTYDPLTDFTPVSTFMTSSMILAVPAEMPANSLAEMIAYGKKKPGGLTYGTQAVGSAGHILGAYLSQKGGFQGTMVPYRGSTPGITELVANRLDMFFTGYTSLKPFHESGKIKLLATTGLQRDPGTPDVPTVREAGFPQIEGSYWFGACAPANTPAPIVKALHDHFAAAVKSPMVLAKYKDLGMIPIADNPERFKKIMIDGIANMKTTIEAAGVERID